MNGSPKIKDIFADLDSITPVQQSSNTWHAAEGAPSPQPPLSTRGHEGYWTPGSQEPENKPRKWVWWLIGGFVLVGLAGGGYFAYSRGYIAVPFLTPKADSLFDKMVESISDIKNAQYSARVNLKSEPRSSDAKPIFLKKTNSNASSSLRGVDAPLARPTSVRTAVTPFSIEDIGGTVGLPEADLGESYLGALLGLTQFDELFGTIPGDINFSGGVTVYVEADKEIKDADGSVRIDGTYKGGDISVDIDLEARKVGKDVFGIIRKFPSFFFIDTSAIKEKWVKLSDAEGTNYIQDEVYTQFDSKRVVNTLKSSVRNALREKVFTVNRKLPAGTIAGVNSEHYLIAIDVEKIVNLYETLIKDAQAKGEDTKKFESIRDALKKPDNMDVLKRIADNSRIEIWIDKVKGFLRQVSWQLVIVPPEGNERLTDKQFVIGITITLEKVNQSVKIDVPSPTIDIDEATRLLTGLSKEDQKAQKQISRIGELQRALNAYQKTVGSFPDSLDQLTPKMRELNDACKQRAEQRKINANANKNAARDYEQDYNCYLYASYEKKSVNITDPYSGKTYTYTKDGDDFKVTYELHIGDSQQLSYYKNTYADGTNTMTSKDVSIEKQTTYETNLQDPTTKDTDGDGLTDPEEETLKTSTKKMDTDDDRISDFDEARRFDTDPLKLDSDDDSFSDTIEIANGYNPTGSGKATETQRDAWTKDSSDAPKITNVNITSSGGSALISWTTDVGADGVTGYGNQPGVMGKNIITYETSQSDTSNRTAHAIAIPVTPGKTYHYALRSCKSKYVTNKLTFTCGYTSDATFIAE